MSRVRSAVAGKLAAMRIGTVVIAVIASLVIAAGASSKPAAETGSCRVGAKAAVVAGTFVCLKVGAVCKTSHQADYKRFGFLCTLGHLTVKPPAAAAKPVPGDGRTNPVPLGKPGSIGNGWVVTITEVTPDASDTILASDDFNVPPAAGKQFFMVAVRAVYNGPDSSNLDSESAFKAVGASNVAYTSFKDDCGTLPDPNLALDDPETFSGGVISGNAVCWQVRSSEVSSLVMYAKTPLSDGTFKTVWFALR
jgi:hypothetical protein